MSELSSRIQKRLAEIGKKPIDLARAVGVKPASIWAWTSGKVTQMRGDNLLSAAKFLKCQVNWLQHGVGPEHLDAVLYPIYEPALPLMARERTMLEAQSEELVKLFESLSDFDRIEALRFMRLFVETKKSPKTLSTQLA